MTNIVDRLAPSCNKEFKELIDSLYKKYGSDVFEINGIGSQLDINSISKKFFRCNTTADASVDANANVSDKSVVSHRIEIAKPAQLLNSFYRLWKELKKSRGISYANKIIESQINGRMYVNDFTGFSSSMPYCFNYSTYDTALMGIPSVFDGRGGSKPPKNLMSFLGQIELFSLIAGNSTLGATGLADLLIVIAVYVDKIIKTGYDAHFKISDDEKSYDENVYQYIESLLTGFIYRLNQPYRGSQSLFSNVSIYDDNFLEQLIPSYELEIDEKIYAAKKDIVKKVQEIYVNIMNREMERKPITFPVTTACFSTDKDNNILDKEFLNYISKVNLKFGFINIYCGDSSTLSSCCFDGKQKVVAKSSYGVLFDSIKNIHRLSPHDEFKKNLTVYHNGSWCSAKTIKIPLNNKKMFKITTSNNKELFVTDDHIHVTNNGDKKTSDLTVNDYLAFSNRKLDSFPEKCQKLTYEQGYLIGLYLGDGSKYKRNNCENYEITFSLNESNTPDLDIIKKALSDWNIEKELHIHMQNNTMLTKIYSKELYNIINEYIDGNYAPEKELNMNILLQSVDFRRGICDGWYSSDGGNSNRIYTTSDKLIPQAEMLFNSIGINTIVDVCDRTGENKVIIREKEYNRNYPLYCIRWYDMKNKRTMGEVYRVVNNTEYFKIKTIEEYDLNEDFVYCFEIKNQSEPYFTLPNGAITHNCRLRSEQDNEYFNSFGSGSSKIGSLGVCTGNLPQLAQVVKTNINKNIVSLEEFQELRKAPDFEFIGSTSIKGEFLKNLKDLVVDCQEVNNAKRNIVKRAIKSGAHPIYSLGYMDLKKQYSTFGVIGLYEALEILGLSITSPEGEQFVYDIMDIVNNTNKELQAKYKAPHNCEQIPGENVAVKLAKKDKILGLNERYNLYSNQFIPLTKNVDMLDRIEMQGKFDKHFSGGAICHLNLDQEIQDSKTMSDLIEMSAKKGVVYFAINYILQECENNHMSVGKLNNCPICNAEIIGKYTRVVGFLTKVENWNSERKNIDFPNRQFYKGI